VQILGLQAVERRESPEYCEIERSFIHQKFADRYGFNPMILAANATICGGFNDP
jgi:hypothetical protein